MATPIKMKVFGLKELKAKLGRLPDHAKKEVSHALKEGADLVAQDAADSILTGSRTGIMYGEHQASAPGEPPASDTGALAASITVVGQGTDYQVVATAPYARHLELGTSKMEARPYLVPALQRNRRRIKNLINSALKTALKLARLKK